MEDHLNRSLVLWVYNSEFDVVREVELVPRRGWGGEGALGAVLGFGALHRLPVGLGEEMQEPGENLFDADKKSGGDTFNPTDTNAFQPAPAQVLSPPPMVNPSVPPPPMMNPKAPPPGNTSSGPSRTRKGRHHGATSPNNGFEDIFSEGQKKSAEQDHVPSRKGTPIAPPPRAGSAAIPPHSVGEEKKNPIDDAGEELGEPGEAEET